MASILNMIGGLLGGTEEEVTQNGDSVAKETEQPLLDKESKEAEPELPSVAALSLSDDKADARPAPPAYSENLPETEQNDKNKGDASDAKTEFDNRAMMVERQLNMVRMGPEKEKEAMEKMFEETRRNLHQVIQQDPEKLKMMYQQLKQNCNYQGPMEADRIHDAMIENMRTVSTKSRQQIENSAKAEGISLVAFLERQLEHYKKMSIQGKATIGLMDSASPNERPHPRIAVGKKVLCNCGPQWLSGTVTKHWYREPSWPHNRCAPYQIQLDSGQLIFAPLDNDSFIKLR